MSNNLPAEWYNENGNKVGSNKHFMDDNVHETQKGLIKKIKDNPPITIPDVDPFKKQNLTKNFAQGVDEQFKTRSSQLPNSYFKEMPALIRVCDCKIEGHYLPGITDTPNDLNSRPREFAQVKKRNEFGFDRTMTKEITHRKIDPVSVSNPVSNKNKMNYITTNPGDTHGHSDVIQLVSQMRTKILVKH
tara:strand:- start:5808 stop:6374 length:567 start_codon:yes stop_codon:yes gene_type:complete